ncbi:cell division protein ZapA [Planococcus beigongshangi]|uniref:cell division protein ZapA n=1 Tax=Planococcus beigongshangi TaxID=2782536 RepID=UPI003D7B8B3B
MPWHKRLGDGTLSDQQRIRTSVEIYGHTYKMVGTETSGHMRLVASAVDEKMREIHAMNPSLDSSRLAVLTAVNAVHDNLKLKERIEQLEIELNKLKG